MLTPNVIILYVDSPEASGAFYAKLLGQEPVEASATFVRFALSNGVMLGLWSRHTVEPAASAAGGGGELGFAVANDAAVEATYAKWGSGGLTILQERSRMDFGYTFVALDPDGHRLRVFAIADE